MPQADRTRREDIRRNLNIINKIKDTNGENMKEERDNRICIHTYTHTSNVILQTGIQILNLHRREDFTSRIHTCRKGRR